MRRIYADLGLLTTALIWGVTFPLVKIAIDSVSPFAFNSIRFFLSTILFLPLFSKQGWREGMKIGLATFLGYTFQTFGLKFTTATNAGFITSIYVVFAPILAYAIYGMPLKLIDFLGLIIAFFGFYLLSGYCGFRMGDLLIILCAFCFAMEIAMISFYSKKINPTSLAFWQVLAVALFSTPFALFTTSVFEINRDVVYALIVTVIFATFVAKILQNALQRHVKVAEASVILSLEGLFAHLFGLFMLGESLSLIQYFGALLITLAVILVSVR